MYKVLLNSNLLIKALQQVEEFNDINDFWEILKSSERYKGCITEAEWLNFAYHLYNECEENAARNLLCEFHKVLECINGFSQYNYIDYEEFLTFYKYRHLEELFQGGDWKAADQENYRLMITAVGKKEGEWFDLDDFENFPSEVLDFIDKLWIKHSNGKFGFSVQKQIYMDCGGTLDWRYQEQEWNQLCSEVGWQSEGRYVPVRYDLGSPRGHLPGGCWKFAEPAPETLFDRFSGPLLSHQAIQRSPS